MAYCRLRRACGREEVVFVVRQDNTVPDKDTGLVDGWVFRQVKRRGDKRETEQERKRQIYIKTGLLSSSKG